MTDYTRLPRPWGTQMALGLFLAAAHLAWADPDFPLRNGDFSRLGHANGTPADWGFLSQTGQYQLQVEPATADAPAGVRLKAIQPGRGVLYQDILLLPGSYVLRLEARTEGGGRAGSLLSTGVGKSSLSTWSRVSCRSVMCCSRSSIASFCISSSVPSLSFAGPAAACRAC